MRIIRKNVRGYFGMNRPAAIALKLKSIPPEGTIYVSKELKGRMLKRTIAHEKFEQSLMERGVKYKKAHSAAMKWERNIK